MLIGYRGGIKRVLGGSTGVYYAVMESKVTLYYLRNAYFVVMDGPGKRALPGPWGGSGSSTGRPLKRRKKEEKENNQS